MPTSPTDQLAREAARLHAVGQADSIGEAIRMAVEALGLRGVAPPSAARVRQHIQGMTMQAIGAEAYDETVRDTWRVAEEIMTVLDEAFDDAEPRLMGRAARGMIDGDAQLFIRVHTRAPIGSIAECLVERGYEEPDFETADTRFGRFDRIRFVDDGHEVIMTRCLPDMLWKAGVDLFKQRPVASVDVDELRERLAVR